MSDFCPPINKYILIFNVNWLNYLQKQTQTGKSKLSHVNMLKGNYKPKRSGRTNCYEIRKYNFKIIVLQEKKENQYWSVNWEHSILRLEKKDYNFKEKFYSVLEKVYEFIPKFDLKILSNTNETEEEKKISFLLLTCLKKNLTKFSVR